ncbi:unnamed protein product [Spodoptera exigua]|nr:unnamed protein product [Spodoptera exigua]
MSRPNYNTTVSQKTGVKQPQQLLESLDFLSPPVKRLHTSREFGSVYNTEANDVHLLRGLRNKFAQRASSSTKNIKPIKKSSDSSTSLILKKTSERQILEQYSIVSYTSLQQPENDTPSVLKTERSPNPVEKPLIKVTVIPKTDQIQTAKLLRRRRYVPKRVQSTTSNHENSIQTKNVYLIVAGRRREKIYEIKTTGSAKLSTDHDSYIKDDEIPIKELSNFKHLIQSLNMDRKKKKEKKEKKALMDKIEAPPQASVEWRYPSCQDCLCGDESNESPKKSRVKIFGQFGISEDDKYVLRYGATINDKQVLSDVAQLTRDFSPILATTSYGTTDGQSAMQKDSCIQADYDASYENPPITEEVPRNQDTYTLPNASQVYEDKGYTRMTTNRLNETGTNTEHFRKKRTLIEAYTKQLTDQMSQKDSIPARYNSTVTINIDGDGEYYDVLFNQDKRSTDLTIRKTFKDMGSQKYDDQDQECSASLENFMYVPEIIVEKESSKPQDDSHSKSSIYNNPSDDDFSLDNHVSRLTIRDSLEISHRRGGKHMHNSNNLKNTQTCFTAQIATTVPNATEFLAPIKHFIGDDCSITDPVERDKQIRQLLGVDKLKQSFTAPQQQYDKVKKTIQKTICIKKSSHEKRRCIPVKRDKNESYLETHASSEIMSLKAKSKHSKRSSCKRNKPYTKRAECTVYGKRQRHESPVLYRRYEDPVLSSKYDRPEVDDRCERPMLYGKYEKFGDFEMFDEPDELQLPRKLDKPVASGKRDKCDKREKSSKHEKCGKRSKCDKHEKREASRKRSKCATSEKRKNLVEADSHEKCQDPPVHRKRDKSSSGKRHRSPSPGKRHRSPSPGKRHRSPSPGKRHRSPSPGKREGKKCRSSTKRVKSGTSVKRDKSKTSSKCKKSGTSSKCKKSGSTSRLEKSESCHKHDKPKKIVERVKCQKSDVSIGAVRTKRPIEKVKECHKKSAKQEKFAQVEAKCSEVSCKKYREERLWPRPSKCKTANKDNEETKTDSCDKKRKQKIIENVEVFKLNDYDENSLNGAGDDDRRRNKKHEHKGVWTVEHTSTPVVQQRHAECFTNIDVGTGRDEVNSSTSEQVDDPDRLSEQRSPSVYEYSNDLQQESLAHRACIDSMDIEHQETEMKTFVLFNAENTANAYDDNKDTDFDRRTRKTVSSVEVRYASVAYMKQVAYSSTDVGALSNSSMTHVKSFHTIFRGCGNKFVDI